MALAWAAEPGAWAAALTPVCRPSALLQSGVCPGDTCPCPRELLPAPELHPDTHNAGGPRLTAPSPSHLLEGGGADWPSQLLVALPTRAHLEGS